MLPGLAIRLGVGLGGGLLLAGAIYIALLGCRKNRLVTTVLEPGLD